MGAWARALKIYDHLGLQDTSSYADVLAYVGQTMCYADGGSPQKALLHLEQSLAIRRKVLPPNHPAFVEVSAHIRDAHSSVGNVAAAAQVGAVHTTILRRSQVACAGPGCPRRLREDGAPLDVCVKCRRTFYCGKACQTADWKREGGHRAECKALIAEGKVAEGPPVAQYRVPVGEFIP